MTEAPRTEVARKQSAEPACPDCGTRNPVPLLWGMPDSDTAELASKGLVELAGCVIGQYPMPDWQCGSCGFRWSSEAAKIGYRREPGGGEWSPDPVDGAFRCCTEEEVALALEGLDGNPQRIAAADWPANLQGLEYPGLYSWWVDESGARALAEGLDLPIKPGRIYAGQAGATSWPSGKLRSSTLRTRIGTNHLAGNVYGSTFRLTFASVLQRPLDLVALGGKKLDAASENKLSSWMRKHLEVAVHPFPRRGALEDLEERVLSTLDPPLNIDKMVLTTLRRRVRELRSQLRSPASKAPPIVDTARKARPTTRRSASDDKVRIVGGEVTLHEEMADILRERGNRWMNRRELAALVNERGRYHKKDGSEVTDFQIHGRARQYSHMFERQGSLVRLRESRE